MEKIHILCDSAGDLSREYAERYHIEIVPIQITYEGKTLREFYDITPAEYWDILKHDEEIPLTSQTTPAQWLEYFRQALAREATHVIAFIINAKGSGSFQSACIARDLFYDEYGENMHIELVDGEAYSMVYGRAAVLAAQMAEQGDSFDAIMGVVRSRLKRSEAILGVYTLKHLKKSGRISGGAAFVGEALGLKPISLVCAGGVNVCGKARGDKNLIPKLVELVRERVRNPQHQIGFLMYGAVPEEKIAELEQNMLQVIGFGQVERMPLGVSVTTNSGPEALAIAYLGAERD